MDQPTKIFGIGLSKTGTTTLGRCFETLGFSNTGYSLEMLEALVIRRDLEEIFRFVEAYDSFEDNPWFLMYRELDQRFPNSKFILTERKDADTWLESSRKYVQRMRREQVYHSRELAYGYRSPEGYEAEHLGLYETHNSGVRDYFRHRPDDLLVVCWEKGDGWSELCRFLGRPLPNTRFPHLNARPGLLRRLGTKLHLR